jgi:hypothetical protein
MKVFAIVASALLFAAGCSSSNTAGGTGGSGQGGAPSAGSGGAKGTGGATTNGTGGATASGFGGSVGTGGAGGHAGSAGTGTGGASVADGGVDIHPDATVDAVSVADAAVGTNGAYVRTGWTGVYTCTGTCLAGNGDSSQDAPPLAFDGNFQTRWSTDRFEQDFWNANPRQFPLYFTVDMKQVVNVSRVTIHPSCRDIFDTAGQLDVLVSVDGTTFTPVVTAHRPAVPPNGEACPPTANAVAMDSITFTRTTARFIQIKATMSLVTVHPTSGDKYWAIGEFNAFP